MHFPPTTSAAAYSANGSEGLVPPSEIENDEIPATFTVVPLESRQPPDGIARSVVLFGSGSVSKNRALSVNVYVLGGLVPTAIGGLEVSGTAEAMTGNVQVFSPTLTDPLPLK